MFEGLRKPDELIVTVVTLLAYGCPTQAIVHAFEIDERTVARWQERAGQQCQRVHTDQVVQANLDLHHVQADDPLDSHGHDGFDALVEGRGGQSET